MLKKRIIPILLLDDCKLVKTTRFKNPRYVGDPINSVKIFNEKEVDELIILDIKASKFKNIEFDLIENLAGECRMPFAYGGGISKIEDANILFSMGVEKLILNSVLFEEPDLVYQLSKKFGSQSVILSINIKKNIFGKYKIYNWIKKKFINIEINYFIEQFIKLGVGEIFITFVDNEGTLNGFDLLSLEKLNLNLQVPLIVNGGFNSNNDMKKCLNSNLIDAIAVGSHFVYYGPHRAVLINYPNADEKEKILDR